ncbi:hypothetical protein GW17_00029969 [Ensete ventricosum]|nr:hypothetical protein GW17_00029969 [Ensete ventricosum]
MAYRKLMKANKREHHLWMKRDSTGSGQKALNLVRTVRCCLFRCNLYYIYFCFNIRQLKVLFSILGIGPVLVHGRTGRFLFCSCIPSMVEKLPNEKEVIYGALDKWAAWETEFPVIAAAKALEILRKRRKWLRIIQVWLTDVFLP